MKNLKISQKLILSFAIVILLFGSSIAYQLTQQRRLAILQDQGHARAEGLRLSGEAASMGYKLYQVIADAVINRNLTESDKLWSEIKENAKLDFDELRDILDTKEEEELFNEANEHVKMLMSIYEMEMLPLLKAGASIDKIRDIDSKLDEQIVLMQEPLEKINASLQAENEEADVLFDSLTQNVLIISMVVSVLAVLTAIFFIFALLNLIAKPLSLGVAFAKEISEGNLLTKLEIRQKDEIGALAKALQDMVVKLSEVVQKIKTNTEYIENSSQEVSSSADAVAQGANEQASSAEEISASMEEMAATVAQNSANAQTAESMSKTAVDNAFRVNQSYEKMLHSLNLITSKISIIHEIAERTDLLAVNASIEAAKAGESGNGFAVVANEVRQLAIRSRNAADEVDKISIETVESSKESGVLLALLIPDIQKTSSLVQEIAAASNEQDTGAKQINEAVQQFSAVTQQNSASSEELAASATNLRSLSYELNEVISFFLTENDGNDNMAQLMKMITKHNAEAAKIEALMKSNGRNFKKNTLNVTPRDHKVAPQSKTPKTGQDSINGISLSLFDKSEDKDYESF